MTGGTDCRWGQRCLPPEYCKSRKDQPLLTLHLFLYTYFSTRKTMDNAEPGPSRSPARAGSEQGRIDEVQIAPILRLPPELFDTFLHHVHPQDLQATALALSRVFPDHPISRIHLWRHIIAHTPAQMMPMWKKMREMKGKQKEGGPESTRTFSMVRHLVIPIMSGPWS